MINQNIITCCLVVFFLTSSHISTAVELKAHGIVDIRASSTNSLDEGYLVGGQGKFGSNDGQQLSIAQAGVELSAQWENGFSAHGVLNAYLAGLENDEDRAAGITEAYIKYKGLPNASGYRIQIKGGIFYPEISLENNAYAWASKNTLNSSTLNTWLGEEIRVLGSEFKVTRLGRMNNDAFDLSLSATAFINNDPAGALIAWHGWTMSSRQTLWGEAREFPWFPALADGAPLAKQADKSEPFLEIDDNAGYHVRAEWSLHGKGELSAGYYDNKAIPYQEIDGQYGWRTRFYHLGARWRISKSLSLTAQYLSGSTLMQSPLKEDMVNNDYSSGFVSLTYQWQGFFGSEKSGNKKHKSTLRLEDFSVTDNDNTWGDNNNEDGQALTLNHSYRLSKHWFLSAEFNYIDSHRPARYYTYKPADLVEKQLQLAARYFF
ncbi:MAG: hypothetical protein JKY81_10915 [Colwellia sp.]|nr:hypothetical protein [Colwellia sp.]